jgi:predicted O-linked N-acetylglucosamine transferase (SPINDLY family)
MIRRDKIDILIELTGHTAGNRLDVMAIRPAPIAVTWIGYPNSTGLPTIDYRFTDAIVDPPETKQRYSETLVRLPGPFLCYTPPTDAPEVSETPAVGNGFVTFGSFNNLAKVNQRVLQVWCAILNRVRDSRMLIKCKPFASDTVRTKVLQRFEKLGVPAKRVDLTPLLPTTKEHLSMYSMIDISLDTFPYAGTTTTCEALFMGVPVITLAKQHNHAHSVGATLLSRIKGLGEFVTYTETDYVEKAVALATNLPRLSALRRTVRTSMVKSPVCDGKAFTKGLEDTYVDLWSKYVENHDKKVPTGLTISTTSSTNNNPSSTSNSGNNGGVSGPGGAAIMDADFSPSETESDSSHLALLHGLD